MDGIARNEWTASPGTGGRHRPEQVVDIAGIRTNFIRELGMTLCNKLTPYLFLDDASRPSADLIDGATTALKYRNEIMHASRNKQGEYRHRLRSKQEIDQAYKAALGLYRFYRDAYDDLNADS